jgi:uncharacterized protein (UPF0261 family)
MGMAPFFTPGGPLHDALGYKAFLKALKNHLHAHIPYKEVDAHINDGFFVDLCVKQLVTFMNEVRS